MNAPEWNQQDRAGSFELWVEELKEEARVQFLEAGTHLEIFFVFNDDGLMEVVPIVGMEKDDVASELTKMLAERKGYAFIHIAEGTAKNMDSADEADMLIVHAESREGLSTAFFSAVVLQGENKMLLDAVQVDGSQLGGRFAGIFQSMEG